MVEGEGKREEGERGSGEGTRVPGGHPVARAGDDRGEVMARGWGRGAAGEADRGRAYRRDLGAEGREEGGFAPLADAVAHALAARLSLGIAGRFVGAPGAVGDERLAHFEAFPWPNFGAVNVAPCCTST